MTDNFLAPVHPPAIRLAWTGLLLALLALLLGAASGLGHRAGLWHFTTAFAVLGVAVLAGLAGLIASAIALVRLRRHGHRPPMLAAALGAALGMLVVGLPAKQLQLGMTLPRIHDITTDTADPPAFVAIAPLRADAPNPPGYAGEPVARQQLAGYPQIAPHFYRANRHVVFNEALEVVRRRGWNLVASEPEAGRLEASAVSRWFGFVDDIVIRVADSAKGTRVDVRSKSRVGLGDLGANAKRVESLLAEMDTQLN